MAAGVSFLYNRKLCSLLYKNAPRGSHCGREEYGCFAAPPQAENPARQDSLLSLRKFLQAFREDVRGFTCTRGGASYFRKSGNNKRVLRRTN
ncbi:hypothetical protein CLOM621_07732 [Clostridium sp. M62/1]|nr:hypothetical protein CLOM621_07732 [Clostridium sp. M62/1]